MLQASKERTTIIVAHRLSTIRGANKIVVISEGKVVEQGTHDELMDLKGEYFSLVTMQVSSDDSVTVSSPGSTPKLLIFQVKIQPIYFLDVSNVPHSPLDFEDGKRLSNASIKDTTIETYTNDEDEEEKLKNLSLWDIVKLNNEELPQILLGCLASFVMGATMPIFAILFGEIIGVCTHSCKM